MTNSLSNSAPSSPPFSYGCQADPANRIFPMTPGNAAPSLVVWMYLVTADDFLDELEKVNDKNGDFDPEIIPIDDIAKHTHLTADTVRSILDVYIQDAVEFRSAWRHVVSMFQAFSHGNNPAWHPNDCPKGAILSLAVNGAIVDPDSPVPPPLL
jgi:hypothetical protein